MAVRFQSTLPRRERPPAFSAQKITYHNFNPRSREGSDIRSRWKKLLNNISIHAPAKGATYWSKIIYPALYFNPRSREGSDFLAVEKWYGQRIFQSTLPRRERLLTDTQRTLSQYFNPRSREGSDEKCNCCICVDCVFQSTLPRRERPLIACILTPLSYISIHAPAKGATVARNCLS